ncbi:MAG: flagellar biosynthesis protein FlhF [Magnetococcales bacterium]|nr:flagellar biosynthesis protein FlhF [Magnetococcales bacterium]
MKISTFQARDMREALLEVKEKLGPDAVILSTRSIRVKGKAGLPTGRSMIEVTACPNPGADGSVPTPSFPRRVATGEAQVSGEAAAKPGRGRLFSAVVDDPVEMAPKESFRSPPPEPARRRAPAAVGGRISSSSDLSDIRSSLRTLEERVSGLPSILDNEATGLGPEGKKRYSWLLMHGVEEPIARKIAAMDQEDVEGGLESAFKKVMQFRDPLDGRARVIALVGPTGVGKTTTLAKIAAELILNRRQNVGMITLDTFRVGAVAQLETYAKLLQVRLVVARSLSEVKAGLQSLNRCDFILVDTVGSSPYNRRQVNSTGGLLPVMGEDREVMLCMAANVRESEQQAIYRRFYSLSPTGLIFTKLDETVTYGGVLNVALRAQIPLTLFTDGQRVPENLGWMSAKKLAQWFQKEHPVEE